MKFEIDSTGGRKWVD